MDAVVATHGLTKFYGGRTIALSDVSLRVPRRAVYGLLGPNGAGKTTLLRLLVGLQLPTAGRVDVFGEPMTPDAAHLRARIGFLPTSPRFPPHMTSVEYLEFVGRLFGLGAEERRRRLANLIRAVGLLDATDRPIRAFSTGMVTRLGVAASLMNDPELLIWDEPASGLDPEGRHSILELIRQLGRERTVLVSSHILADIDRVCDSVGVLRHGKLVFQGTVREMKRFTRRQGVYLEAEGDVETLLSALAANLTLPVERKGPGALVRFPQEGDYADGVARVVQAVRDAGLELVTIRSAGDEIEDAYLELLEEESSRGFSNAFDA